MQAGYLLAVACLALRLRLPSRLACVGGENNVDHFTHAYLLKMCMQGV